MSDTTTFDFGDGPVPAHRHPYGGGWVADTATVEQTAYVGPNAQVFDKAWVFDKARVSGGAQVFGDARVFDKAWVFDKARVFGEAQVYGEALMYEPKSAIPFIPELDRKIADVIDGGGRLDMRNWHTCQTTHCRAGWAIHLAGESGSALEREVGPWLAGALIYQKSTGRVPDFFADTDSAMRDIRKCAAAQ